MSPWTFLTGGPRYLPLPQNQRHIERLVLQPIAAPRTSEWIYCWILQSEVSLPDPWQCPSSLSIPSGYAVAAASNVTENFRESVSWCQIYPWMPDMCIHWPLRPSVLLVFCFPGSQLALTISCLTSWLLFYFFTEVYSLFCHLGL